jgi:hypothetical protein
MVTGFVSVVEVAELAGLPQEAPARVGVVEEVLQAAAGRRGMTLILADTPAGAPSESEPAPVMVR